MEEISEVNSEGKEEAEEEYQPEDFNPDSNSSGRSLTAPTEYDPCEPELQLQYLDNEVNIMEVKEYLKKEQKKVDTGVNEDELCPITCPFCDYCCNDWDTPPESGSNELKAGSPGQDDDSWRPKSPDEAYLNSLHQWTSITPPPDASKDKPEEMYCFSSSSVPIYMTEIGSPKVSASAAETANVPVKTILDTGAESNYVLAKKAWEAGVTLWSDFRTSHTTQTHWTALFPFFLPFPSPKPMYNTICQLATCMIPSCSHLFVQYQSWSHHYYNT